MQTSSSSISLNLNTPDTNAFHLLSNSNLPIKFRLLQIGDQAEVKSLCHDWFPIKYPDQWYDDIVQDNKYYSLAACDISTERIVGLIIANIYPLGNCNREDQEILHKKFSFTTPVCYILILGVVKEYRRQGLASILLDNLLHKLLNDHTCKAIYLHVLYSNNHAIQFYRSKLFQYRIYLPYYYLINGQHHDAYCFVRYINGGYPPLTFTDILSNIQTYLIQTNPCRFWNTIRNFLTNKLLILTPYQRSSLSYKQISRII